MGISIFVGFLGAVAYVLYFFVSRKYFKKDSENKDEYLSVEDVFAISAIAFVLTIFTDYENRNATIISYSFFWVCSLILTSFYIRKKGQ